MSLFYEIKKTEVLLKEEVTAMYELMKAYYSNVTWEDFTTDLHEKNWAIQLKLLNSHHLVGFSTLQVFTTTYDSSLIKVGFSGDTIIVPKYWGSMKLPLAFGNLMTEINDMEPKVPLFWMLITKGFRTYRFLPLYFNKYYPSKDVVTPMFEQGLMEHLGKVRFPDRYDAKTGIIRSKAHGQVLCHALWHEYEAVKKKNAHINFFLSHNPGYVRGDEMLCLSRFTPGNLKPFILRQLKVFR